MVFLTGQELQATHLWANLSTGAPTPQASWTCQRTDAPRLTVSSASQLASALASASCGTEIVLSAGLYDGSQTIAQVCSATSPLLIRADRPQQAKVTGSLSVRGEFACIAGLDFIGTAARVLVGGRSNRIFGNRFSGWMGEAIKVGRGADVEIAYNELTAPAPWLSPDIKSQKRMGIVVTNTSDPQSVHLNGRAYRNYFHDFPAKPIPSKYQSGQSDAISVCEYPSLESANGTLSSGWLITKNLIENHRGAHGVIDIKCSGVTASFNTMLNSPNGRIDIRLGRDSELRANWIENAGGMLLHAGFHRVYGNRLRNAPLGIALEAGDVEWDYPETNLPGTNRVATRRTVGLHLAGNVAKVVVGQKLNGTYTLPALDTLLEQNTGTVVLRFHAGTTIRPTTDVPMPVAAQLAPLTPAAVGLAAMPAAY